MAGWLGGWLSSSVAGSGLFAGWMAMRLAGYVAGWFCGWLAMWLASWWLYDGYVMAMWLHLARGAASSDGAGCMWLTTGLSGLTVAGWLVVWLTELARWLAGYVAAGMWLAGFAAG